MDKNAELESANKEMHSVIEEVYEHLNMIKEEGAVEASKHYQEQIEWIEEEYKKQIVELNNMMNEKNMTIESLKVWLRRRNDQYRMILPNWMPIRLVCWMSWVIRQTNVILYVNNMSIKKWFDLMI